MLILIASAITPPLGRAFIPTGYQSYYVLGDSDSIVKKAMDSATGYNNATAQPWSLFSLVSYIDMATIYVDQRQNGYGFDPSDFSGADAVFEIDKGAVLTMTNWGSPPYYTITPPGSGHIVSGTLEKVDGGDFFFIAGGPRATRRRSRSEAASTQFFNSPPIEKYALKTSPVEYAT
ncbi:MAG: hypothetical protein WC941_06240 [Candidatus Bathyarchaeia archaeon]